MPVTQKAALHMYSSSRDISGLRLVTPPAIEPITVADVRNHLRIESSLGELAPGPLTAALAGAGAGNVDNGAHRYVVTFVTADGETEAGTVSSSVTVADKTANGKVSLSDIQIGGSNVTARKIYRTTAGGATYLLLTTINDNVTTIYTDNTADASLGSAAPSINTTVDPYLTALITTARLTCEDTTKRKLITQTWKQYYDCFPASYWFDLYLPPLQSITSIQYLDVDGATQTFSNTKYHISYSGERARISLNDGESWPDTVKALDAVWVTMVVGYGDERGDVPAPLRHGMLTLIGHLYNMREDVIAGTVATQVPKTSEYLWTPYISREF